MGKKNVMIYIEEEIAEEAKEIGLNISKICENALKEAIKRLQGSYQQNGGVPTLSEASGGIRTRDLRLTKAMP